TSWSSSMSVPARRSGRRATVWPRSRPPWSHCPRARGATDSAATSNVVWNRWNGSGSRTRWGPPRTSWFTCSSPCVAWPPRLAPQHDDLPLWLHEGLATQFEVIRGGRWAGFGRAHDLRLPDWRRIDPRPRLVPLLRDAGFGHGYQRDAYAAAWALVYYLRKEH